MMISPFVLLFLISVPENAEEKAKRRLIESALKDPETSLEQWRDFARSDYGLINGEWNDHKNSMTSLPKNTVI